MGRVEQLVVENYRGASSRLCLQFEQDKPLALLFGENGTGKSTIADAFDAIGNCSKGSLENRSSVRGRDHLPTIGKKAKDIRIELKASGRTWSASLSGDTITVAPADRPKIRVLRRSQILRLVEAEPAKRYEELRGFIDVEKVEKSEKALLDAANGIKSELDLAVSRKVQAEEQLGKIWESEGKPGSSALEWAKTLAIQDPTALSLEAQSLRSLQSAISSAETALTDYQQASSTVIEKEVEATSVEKEVATLPGADSRQVLDLTKVLREVERYLSNGSHPDECPVCQQEIQIDHLKANIKTRLAEFQQFDTYRIKRETAVTAIQTAKQLAEPKITGLIASARSLFKLVRKEDISQIKGKGLIATNFPLLASPQGTDTAATIEEARSLIGISAGLKTILADVESALTRKTGQINSIRIQIKDIQDNQSNTEHLNKLQDAMTKAYNIVRLTRINFTQRILDEVAEECNRLYKYIHPAEPLAISKLTLDQAKRASLNQSARFETFTDVPPQAYFSESHLDTLGFCFWLAIAKRESLKGDAVIVLDDVFTSVDASHLSRIAQLIDDESQNFAHVIVTTHQRQWRDIYRYHQGPGKRAHIVDLQRWSLGKGITSYRTRLSLDELLQAIKTEPFDRQGTATKSGVLLEALLDHLALQYRCSVPRCPENSYTLSELLGGTTSLFRVLQVQRPELDGTGNIEHTTSSPGSLIASLRDSVFVRNQVGAHYNIHGSAISDDDVTEFAKLTVQLAEMLSCEVCGQIPGKKMGTHFQCSCPLPRETRLLPLQL